MIFVIVTLVSRFGFKASWGAALGFGASADLFAYILLKESVKNASSPLPPSVTSFILDRQAADTTMAG
jgi:hypothetical protein